MSDWSRIMPVIESMMDEFDETIRLLSIQTMKYILDNLKQGGCIFDCFV